MLHFVQSNCLEALATELAEVLRTPLPDALMPDTIVVQHPGIAQWLSLRLASMLGISANFRFPLPAQFIWNVFRAVLPAVPEAPHPFEGDVLTWRVLALLQDLDPAEHWEELRRYIDRQGEREAYELAGRIALTFERYLVYRPQWIRAWERGEDRHWQAQLWRRLAPVGARHWLHIRDEFMALPLKRPLDASVLAPRVCLFALRTLSPAYFEVMARLGATIDVHFFYFNPCRQYFGDVVSSRKSGAGEVDAGNPLIASLARQGRDVIDTLLAYDPIDHEVFVEPRPAMTLGRIQADLLDLIDRGAPGAAEAIPLPDLDSLQIHACPGPQREVEVLHDQLLHLFTALPDLRPSEVRIMTPDIERYAPHIEAIFDTSGTRIPYSIAGRAHLTGSPLVEAFLRLLEVARGRCTAADILDLLDAPPILARQDFTQPDITVIRRWVRKAGIRWGVDGEHLHGLGLPAFPDNTWKAGMDRLLIGYALPPEDGDRVFEGMLPSADTEGDSAQLLGRFVSFCEDLWRTRPLLEARRPVAAWAAILRDLAAEFIEPGEAHAQDLAALRRALAEMERSAARAGFSHPTALDVIVADLSRRLDARFSPASKPGALSVCSLAPWHCVPARVLCLIGLDDERYPRSEARPSFDLMAHDVRPADPNQRDADRHLFLEAMQVAREVLYISFCGTDPRDQTERLPSVLVSELLDYTERAFSAPPGKSVRELLVIKHPLQAFSRRYFDGESRLFSYSRSLCEAIARQQDTPVRDFFIHQRLPEPGAERRSVSLDQLLRFLGHPIRFLLQERLGMFLPEGEDGVEDSEPFALDRSAGAMLKDRLLRERILGNAPEISAELVRARALLPHGRVGELAFDQQRQAVEVFYQRLQGVNPGRERQTRAFDLPFDELRLSGQLTELDEQGLLLYRLRPVSVWDRLSLWVQHLALNCLQPAGIACRSQWLGEDRKVSIEPIAHAPDLLRNLLDLYWEGLNRPLHLFPRSSRAYAAASRRSRSDPLRAARNTWIGNEHSRGERDDPYNHLCFRGADPLDEEFSELALRVFSPFIECVLEESA